MIDTVRLERASRGTQFQALRLHGASATTFDPFMGIDHAWMSAPTFPPHPHAGFSAVTYLFADSETGMANRDSLGHRNLIAPGGLHWTAAGSGVLHEEIPAVPGQTVHLLQIFVNLPQARQSDAPFMLGLAPQDVPVLEREGLQVRVPLGSFAGLASPLQPPTPVTLLDVWLDAGATLDVPVPAGQRAFFMPVIGNALLDRLPFGIDTLSVPIIEPQDAGAAYALAGGVTGARVAIFMGAPLQQPVYANGPMSFATGEQLNAAVSAYRSGAMGRL